LADKNDYKLGAKAGFLFGIVWGALGEPLQALGFVGFDALIHGRTWELVEVVRELSQSVPDIILYAIVSALVYALVGIIYAIIFVKVRNMIPTKRTVTKGILFFSIAWLISSLLPWLIDSRGVGYVVNNPWASQPWGESVIVSAGFTLFWGAIFGAFLNHWTTRPSYE